MGGSAMKNGAGVGSLEYYSQAVAAPRRPGKLTATAVAGIILSAALLLVQSTIPWAEIASDLGGSSSNDYSGYSPSAAVYTPPAAKATPSDLILLVLLVWFNSAGVFMLVGSAGVLALRESARRMMRSGAWGWIIFCAIILFFLGYLWFEKSGRVSSTKAMTLGGIALAWVSITLLFPILTLRCLNSPAANRAFELESLSILANRQTAESVGSRLWMKAASLILLIYGSLAFLSGITAFLAITVDFPGPWEFGRWQLPTAPPAVWAALTHTAVSSTLEAALVVGCILVLRDRKKGPKIVVAYAVGTLIWAVTFWSFAQSPGRMTFAGDEKMLVLSRWMWFISSRATSILLPGVIAAAFGLAINRRSSRPADEQPSPPVAQVVGAPAVYSMDP